MADGPQPPLPPVNAARANGGTRGASAITCRIAARQQRTAVAGNVRLTGCLGTHGHRWPARRRSPLRHSGRPCTLAARLPPKPSPGQHRLNTGCVSHDNLIMGAVTTASRSGHPVLTPGQGVRRRRNRWKERSTESRTTGRPRAERIPSETSRTQTPARSTNRDRRRAIPRVSPPRPAPRPRSSGWLHSSEASGPIGCFEMTISSR